MSERWIVDADGHVVEPPEVWEKYLPTRFWHLAPHVVQDGDEFFYACGDRYGFRIPGRAESTGAPGQTPHKSDEPVPARGGGDPAARLEDMAVDGIGFAALYPTFGLMIQAVPEREGALALCRAMNDWLAEYCAHDPSHLIGIGTLPMTDAGDALAEARRCVEELGFRGVWRRPEHLDGMPRLQDDAYEPLWSYLEEADVPFAIHPGISGVIPYDAIKARFGDYFPAAHAAHFVVEQQLALTTFVAYGILERHPSLRVGFLETGALWALAYVHRLDEHLETFGFDRGKLTLRPSEYFRRQCVVSIEEVEPALGAVLDAFPESVVFASDYPHADGVFPGSTKELLETDELDDGARRAVLAGNARRFYGLGDP